MSTSFSALQSEYQYLWSTMQLNQSAISELDRIVGIASSHKADYQKVSAGSGTPWYVIAAIHNLEGSQNFSTHLHNGDPLSGRTYHVPAGRPKVGNPPFDWASSAIDALSEKVNGTWKTVSGWSIPATLWKCEMYNGWGYIAFTATNLRRDKINKKAEKGRELCSRLIIANLPHLTNGLPNLLKIQLLKKNYVGGSRNFN